MTNKETWAWLGIAAGAGLVIYFLHSQGILSISTATATPLSVYPEYAYMAQPTTTSMAATARQQAPAAVVPPTPLYASVQQQERSAIYQQCAGASVCSPLTADTQLGF